MGTSAIREILKVVSQPGMLSLAGGIPAPESFPLDIIRNLVDEVISKYDSRAFQYDLTEGFTPLREALSAYVKTRGIDASPDEIMISSGSQSVLDSMGKILLNSGDKVAVEAPTYLGALQAFNPYEPEYIRMDTDEKGLVPDSLDEVLSSHEIKFVYLVPTFQNPSGRTIPTDRRKAIAEIAVKHNALLIEDDPYSALRFHGEELAPIKAYAPDHVVYAGSFSKVFAPGLRIGYHISPPLIKKWMVLAKQGVDLHTSSFNQALAGEYLAGGHMAAHLPKIIKLYRPRKEAMLDAMEQVFPSSFTWSKPEGGMFIWAEGPRGLDLEKLYWKSVERKAAFVPGKFFYTDPREGIETMRLNFTMCNEEQIRKAIGIIADVIREALNQ